MSLDVKLGLGAFVGCMLATSAGLFLLAAVFGFACAALALAVAVGR